MATAVAVLTCSMCESSDTLTVSDKFPEKGSLSCSRCTWVRVFSPSGKFAWFRKLRSSPITVGENLIQPERLYDASRYHRGKPVFLVAERLFVTGEFDVALAASMEKDPWPYLLVFTGPVDRSVYWEVSHAVRCGEVITQNHYAKFCGLVGRPTCDVNRMWLRYKQRMLAACPKFKDVRVLRGEKISDDFFAADIGSRGLSVADKEDFCEDVEFYVDFADMVQKRGRTELKYARNKARF